MSKKYICFEDQKRDDHDKMMDKLESMFWRISTFNWSSPYMEAYSSYIYRFKPQMEDGYSDLPF